METENKKNSTGVGYVTTVKEYIKREKSNRCKVIVVDPEAEYTELMKERVISLKDKRINPFDIYQG
ncbi:hypothetical protein [Ruminiclostridium cellulolyticum]|uniref:Uncharacterized protein n=1 Tax=Ruminiclostridium cellulolyticum (strain ATCC 35319 / DSM 5812 / JCM 6584 / H10) TaxID=394503 RepID=B8I0C4_RUMCH|nr:hypothetical protein [Ruminiclostridium cellulolyticum]ACL77450.1 hypothetical protein Ccel_3159 [Ruminiclostridium cellulolyticum H10]